MAQTVSDPNVWKIMKGRDWEDEHGELMGLMGIYVDDILAYSAGGILRELCKVIQRKWETSVPEFVKKGEKVRFCGMDISRTERGYHLGQSSYTKELLSRYKDGGYGSVIPIAKDMTEMPEEPNILPHEVQAAQNSVGEVLWLITKTRPDLMFAQDVVGSDESAQVIIGDSSTGQEVPPEGHRYGPVVRPGDERGSYRNC